MKLHFLTGSPFKIRTAQQALAPYGITVESVHVDILETRLHYFAKNFEALAQKLKE